jgi:beta-mannosidase
MNMIRHWGGGYYETDDFYDICDEPGIMVWQDFKFGGAMVPGDSAFQETLTPPQRERVWQDYVILFHDIIKSVVAQNGAPVPYWPQSRLQVCYTIVNRQRE